jgi:diguanylate cyclase (GGDEF)-like protein
VGSVLFITVLCLLLGITSYHEYKKALYNRYEAYITDVLDFAASSIDVDDLKLCLEKGEKSDKFDRLQELFDQIKDTHKIDFLYVIIPLHPGEHDNIMNVIAGMSSYEKEYVPENVVELGELTGDSYPAATAAKYYNAMNKEDIVFFEEFAEWGDDYTGIKSLYTSDGEFFAELCVDVPVQEIHDTIRSHMIADIAVIIVLGVLFMLAFITWSTRRIVKPIQRLEKSVSGFVSKSQGEELRMEDPGIHTNNEIGSLASSVMKMADDINDYVGKVVEAERVAAEMRDLASRDTLTGFRNRAAFASYIQELQEQIDHEEKLEFAVAVFDCDDLKGINDQYGHEKGDEYLKTTSRLICSVFKNCSVFRIGGDEFAAVLQSEAYENRADMVDQFYSESDTINGTAQNEWEFVHAAVGIAVYEPEIDQTVSDTVRRADKIMYDNKRGGKGTGGEGEKRSYFMESDDTYWKEQYIIDNFKTALEEHWIKVYYQPIMRIGSGKLAILEALARWIDPVRGMIAPNEFIYVLSRYHRLHTLDLYMAEEVCREFGVRGEAGLPLIPVSVNFSAQDFDYEDIPGKLKEITERYRLTPDSIIVEITEQDIAEGTEHFKEALKQIRASGFRLWIDDFGSGYSSLNVLSQYHVDRIKFDMDLVRHLDDNNGANRRILVTIQSTPNNTPTAPPRKAATMASKEETP